MVKPALLADIFHIRIRISRFGQLRPTVPLRPISSELYSLDTHERIFLAMRTVAIIMSFCNDMEVFEYSRPPKQTKESNVKMILVSNFCWRCGVSVRTGSVIIAVWTMVVSTATLAGAVAWALGGAARSAAEGERWATRARARGLDEAAVQLFLSEYFQGASHLTSSIHAFLYILGVIEAFHVNLSGILLYGVLKKKTFLVNVWVKYSMFAFILRLLLLSTIAILLMSSTHPEMGALLLFCAIIIATLAAYFIVVVNSYHAQLKHKEAVKTYANEWQT